MCGICCLIFTNGEPDIGSIEEWLGSNGYYSALAKRGPDAMSSLCMFDSKLTKRPAIACLSSVLCMRTPKAVRQPRRGLFTEDVLLYNGEIFDGLPERRDPPWSDTIQLFDALESCSECDFLQFVSRLVGPFAFIYYREDTDTLYVARDFFGQRSLLLALQPNHLMISSILCHKCVVEMEIPAGCLIKIALNTKKYYSIGMLPGKFDSFLALISSLYDDVTVDQFSTNPALLTISPDVKCSPECVRVNTDGDVCKEELYSTLLALLQVYKSETLLFIDRLKEAVEKRLKFLERTFRCPILEKTTAANIAVLFSGGVDSLLLALLIDQLWPLDWPLDLINVSFERTQSSPLCDNKPFLSSDRLQARRSFGEIRNLSARQCWHLVEVDVTAAELAKWRRNEGTMTRRHVMRPNCTVMDESLACVTWFAARGIGKLSTGSAYRSTARAVFQGTGADELLAGYSRHRQRYKLGGYGALLDELSMELGRMWHRNMGRDDRVIGDFGKESNLPFLDQNFVKFCNSLPVDSKARLDLPRGLGEKLIIRLALAHLGVGPAAALAPKKAMQFGSGLVNASGCKQKGSDTFVDDSD